MSGRPPAGPPGGGYVGPPGGGYAGLAASGELAGRIEKAVRRLRHCDLCPHRCGAERTAGERGRCRTGRTLRVASAGPHFGEERPLVGRGGSGTIFFSACNLECIYCQNAEISTYDEGDLLTAQKLAGLMLELQERGCLNINLVSPSHVVPQILEALGLAAEQGLKLPLVYNSGGYDSVSTLALLEGVVDIYMPDMKYSSNETAARLSGAPDYADRNREAVREMHRQVGDLLLDERGAARRGLLVRHLVLPGGLAGTAGLVEFLAAEISADTYLNLMDQYHPCHRAREDGRLARRLSDGEFEEARRLARRAGLTRLDGG
jgi:putative pyruvate formate lyase activating enzyme